MPCAMICGVFYREFTKAMGFTGITALGKLHVHLFLLGMVVFLLFTLFDAKFGLQKHKLYIPFMVIYNAGVGIMCIMLLVRGIYDVIGGEAPDGAISGVVEIGYIIFAAGIILFFVMLLLSLYKSDSNINEKNKKYTLIYIAIKSEGDQEIIKN